MELRGVKISGMVFDKISYTLDVTEWKLLLLSLEQMHDLDDEEEKQRTELQRKISEALGFCEQTNREVRG